MVELSRLSEAQKAVLLLNKGLSPRASALRGDPDYNGLLAHWRADPAFRQLAHDLAPMLGLRIIDVLEHAIVLAPLGPESVFAARLGDIRRDLGELPRGAIALIHVAIAATFFPTASAMTAAPEDYGEVSATPVRIAALLRDHCRRLEDEAGDDPEMRESGLAEGWRELSRLPETRPDGSQHANLGSLTGIIRRVLNQLQEHGMMQVLETADGKTWLPTPRYRLQVRELAAHDLFERCAVKLPGFLDGEER